MVETTGEFSADVLSPSRVQASFYFSIESRARFAGIEEALRQNLSSALSDKLDREIIQGTEGLLTGTNLDNNNVSTLTTYALFRDQLSYGRVDGQYASTARDLRIVFGSGSYSLAASAYRSNNDNTDALMSLESATAGFGFRLTSRPLRPRNRTAS